jgi:hypothetical protein
MRAVPLIRKRFGETKSMNSRRRGVEHPDETGVAALVGAARLALRVHGGEEEHVEPLDERPVLVGQRAAKQPLLDAVRETLRIELSL